MGCGCKKTPLEKLEQKISTRGWTRLYPSETAIIDAFIYEKLNIYPTNVDDRIELYKQAKAV
jgi:hypothetical protein